MAKMPFAEDNHVIEAVPPDRADQPLRVAILPRRPRRTRLVPDGGRTWARTWDPLIKSQLFLSNLFFHTSANTRPAVRD